MTPPPPNCPVWSQKAHVWSQKSECAVRYVHIHNRTGAIVASLRLDRIDFVRFEQRSETALRDRLNRMVAGMDLEIEFVINGVATVFTIEERLPVTEYYRAQMTTVDRNAPSAVELELRDRHAALVALVKRITDYWETGL